MGSAEDDLNETREHWKPKKQKVKRSVFNDEGTRGPEEEEEEEDKESAEGPRYFPGPPLRTESGELLKVISGDREGAQLYQSIKTSRREYKLLDNCFVAADEGSMPFLGKIVAIGEGGSQKAIEECGRFFVVLYWYYQSREISKVCVARYRKKGVDLERTSRSILLSFHLDVVSLDALRKPFKVYFSKVEPKNPEKYLMQNAEWCCSYVWDAKGQEKDELSSGELHSLADPNFLEKPLSNQLPYGLLSIQDFVRLCCEKFPYPYPVMDFVYTQLDSKKGPKILKVNPVTKELEKVSKSKENGSSPPDAKVASKKKGEAKSSKKRPLDGSAGTEQDAKRPKPTAGKALGLKNAPKPQAPSQSNAHPPEVKKSSDSIAKKQQMDAKAASLHAKLKEVVKVKRPPARMKDVDSAFNELEAAIESRSSSRVAHEIKELDKIKILPLILNLTQAPSRLQMALQKIQSQPGLGATVTEGKQILDKWHLTLGKYMAKYNMVTGDYEGKQQLISLADKANVRKIGLKLAEKFVTVDAVPLLSESVWKQIGASKNDRFRILSALPQELQNLIEGGIEAWKPQTGGRTSKVNVTYDKEYVPQQLVEVELKVHNLFEKAMHKVSASLAALASNH